MKRLIYLSFLLFASIQINFAQWQTSPPFTKLNQNDVHYSASGKILIVCDNGILLISKESGNSWSKFQLTDNSNLNSILFPDESVGYVAGDRGKIFRIENGGEDLIDLSIAPYFHLKDAAFYDPENGVVAGSKEVHIDGRTYFLPAILITSDYGQSWTEKHFDFRGQLNSVSYTSEGNLLAVGNSGLILKSSDSGNTWNTIPLDVITNLNSVKVCPDYTTIIAGDGGTLLYSYDFGEDWNALTLPFYYNIKGVCFNEYGEMIAAGSKEVHIDGRTYYMATILKLNPDNDEWTELLSRTRSVYNSLAYCNRGKAIAVGDNGLVAVCYSRTSTNTDVDHSSNNFRLEQNYPNPFNPSTQISYKLAVGGKVTLIVYDILGKEVETLVNEYKPAGSYSTEFSAAGNLSSGVYIYKLQSGDLVKIKKMIFLR